MISMSQPPLSLYLFLSLFLLFFYFFISLLFSSFYIFLLLPHFSSVVSILRIFDSPSVPLWLSFLFIPLSFVKSLLLTFFNFPSVSFSLSHTVLHFLSLIPCLSIPYYLFLSYLLLHFNCATSSMFSWSSALDPPSLSPSLLYSTSITFSLSLSLLSLSPSFARSHPSSSPPLNPIATVM